MSTCLVFPDMFRSFDSRFSPSSEVRSAPLHGGAPERQKGRLPWVIEALSFSGAGVLKQATKRQPGANSPAVRVCLRMADAKSQHGERAPQNRTSDNGKGEAVFEVHGKHLVYARSSLYLFDQGSRVRRACVRTVAHPGFERLVLLLILLNSIVLALVDWSVIDEDPGSKDVGEPTAEGSWRNTLLYETEIFFTMLFTLEFVLKVIAQGFVLGVGAYLRDSWNIIDFLVVVTALLTSLPGMPTTSAIRVFRVLRPLRSISALPGLQHLVVSLLRSVPQLLSVVVLLQFIFIVFGIFGIQIFAGKQHSRCRLTPYPVTTAFEVRRAVHETSSTPPP